MPLSFFSFFQAFVIVDQDFVGVNGHPWGNGRGIGSGTIKHHVVEICRLNREAVGCGVNYHKIKDQV